jgi:xylulokinase
MSFVLAFDFGGTNTRGALVAADGTFVARRTLPAARGGSAEADPAEWWRDLCALADALAGDAPAGFAAAQAVAISAFTRTQVFVDAGGVPVHPALMWTDTRAESVLDEMRARVPAGHDETPRLNAFHPAARLHWLKRHAPDRFARLHRVLEPKDWLNFKLSGAFACDRVSMARLAADGLLGHLGLPADLVPTMLAPTDAVGRVLPDLPGALAGLAGRPVVAMANDTWAAVVGLGAMRDGLAYNISGTTEVFGLVTGKPARAEGLLDVVWGEDLHQLGGPGQNGADTLAWCLALLGQDPGGVEQLLEAPRASSPVLFLPYLQGERVPFWDARLRGAFLGLGRAHGAADLVRAVMEGVAFLNRIVLERAEAGSGTRAREIRFGGGGAASATWCRIKADILGRPVVTGDCEEPGLLGAAIAASVAIGRFPGLGQAQAALARPARRFEPDPAGRDGCDALFSVFRDAHAAVAPLSRRLALDAPDRR